MVESSNNSFEDVVKTFTGEMKLSFDKLKFNLPEEMMRKAEVRLPEMKALKIELKELLEQAYAL